MQIKFAYPACSQFKIIMLTTSCLLWAAMACMHAPVLGSDVSSGSHIFLETPKDPKKNYPLFHIGVTGINATITTGLVVTVNNVDANTPATGKFEKGDILQAVNGVAISEAEPYIVLGSALTAAEAGNGQLDFSVLRAGQKKSVTLTIPKLGSYAPTWPLQCKKSDAIIAQATKFLTEDEQVKNPGYFNGLFLLSLDDKKYIPLVKTMVDKFPADKSGGHTWNNGYAGILIGEYYLKTGDKTALPRLKAICEDAKNRQYFGGWCHWDGPSPGYVNGGLMNPAGVQILTTLLLAKECGVDVDEGTLHRALIFFYRFAGHEGVPYGDHRPEGWLSCNGKNGMLTAALSLIDGKAYQAATTMLAVDMADSYKWLGAGHANSFGDHVWRGIAIAHVPDNKQQHFRRSLDKLTWYYDLARGPQGGFSLLNIGDGVGDNAGSRGWGHGLALAYTAPRKTLRITGAPPTRFSKKYVMPAIIWGTARDVEFFSADYCKGYRTDSLEPHTIYNRLGDAYGKPTEKADQAFFLNMLRHYHPTARRQAALMLAQLGAVDELAKALADDDVRVRRAVLEAIDKYHNWSHSAQGNFPPAIVSAKFLPGIVKILEDPNAAWWELDGALSALSRCEPSDIKKYITLVKKYITHEEWWLRESSFYALTALAKEEKVFVELLPILLERVKDETHVKPRRSIMAQLQLLLKDKTVSAAIKEQIANGMVKAQRDITVEPGYASAIGRNNKYETLRYFLAQSPHVATLVLDLVEEDMRRPDYFDDWGWAGAWLVGDKWNNPGVVKCAEKLGKSAGAPLITRCKAILAQLKEQQQKQSKDSKIIIKVRDKMITDLSAAIDACEAKWTSAK